MDVYEEVKITLVPPESDGAGWFVLLVHGDQHGGLGGSDEVPWTESEARAVFDRACRAAAVVIGGRRVDVPA